jgi:hypothetical protein
MRSEIFTRLNFWPSLLTCLFALFIGASSVQAQDITAEITTLQERYVKLENEFSASQARIISAVRTFEAQETAYGQLDYVSQLLVSMNREFDVLNMALALASMVTETRFVPNSNRIKDFQRSYMTNLVSISVQHIEKTIPRVKDPETTRLLLEARNLFRSSSDLLGRLSVKETKKK